MTRRLLNIVSEGQVMSEGFDSWGMKTVNALRNTRYGFHWPHRGGTVSSWIDREGVVTGYACPRYEGDGLSIAITAKGMSSGGYPINAVLLVAYRQADVVGKALGQIRTRGEVRVVFDTMISDLNLKDACLRLANLRRVDLYRACLTGANLTGADLAGADLRDADLTGADLTDANLTGADLTGADLTGVNLTGANLRRVDLTGTKVLLTQWKEIDDQSSGS